MSKFTAVSTEYNNGFTMTFSNGWTISVQFGKANYCNRDKEENFAYTAEIAAWDKDGKWYEFEHDIVKGYCDADEVVDWIVEISCLQNCIS